MRTGYPLTQAEPCRAIEYVYIDLDSRPPLLRQPTSADLWLHALAGASSLRCLGGLLNFYLFIYLFISGYDALEDRRKQKVDLPVSGGPGAT